MIHIIGIDVGRSGVKLAWVSGSGQIKRVRIPKFTDYIDWKTDQTVAEYVQSWCRQAGVTPAAGAAIVIGATGAVEFERQFQHGRKNFELLGDVSVAALSCGILSDGMLLICGTGAALVVFEPGGKHILKAFGPVVGDPWGGLALGRLAVTHLVDAWELGSELTAYENALSAALNIHSRQEYVDWVQNSKNHYGELGKLGKVTLDFAEQEHPGATEIADIMVQAMADAVSEANDTFQFEQPLAIGIQGSMLEKSGWLRNSLEEKIAEGGTQSQFSMPEKSLDLVALDRAESLKQV